MSLFWFLKIKDILFCKALCVTKVCKVLYKQSLLLLFVFPKDICLKNAESWAKLVKISVAPTAIKSSKETFQLFRKAAMEKEERKKQLKRKLMDENDKTETSEQNRWLY